MSDVPTSALVGLLVPKIPSLLKAALWNTLSLSENSSKWDLRTELTINILRSELSKPNPSSISEQQRNSIKIPEVKGPMWVSNATMPAPPEDDVRQELLKAIDDMKTGDETYTVPDLVPVEGEWHGHRANATKTEPDPPISDAEKYARMMKEVKTDAVVLFFHGGAYYLMDASSQRPSTVRYAKMLGGRTFAVRYRLSPQHPFPAPILDALVAYLSLLHPPPGALHDPVPADKIIIAGDSAGGNLALTLVQTLLQWHRDAGQQPPTLSFHGRPVAVPLPAGVALASPWADLARALPSMRANARFDYLPGPDVFKASRFPHCDIWPARPPRAHLYCDAAAVLHPLASPVLARSWERCPPVLLQVGEEMMADEAMVVAQRMAGQGVPVRWMQFEAMPHCFALLLEENPSTKVLREAWKEWGERVVRGERVVTGGEFVAAKSLAARKVDVERLTGLTDEEVLELMREALRKLEEGVETRTEVPPVV
ncbi:hypothetical protein SLS56_007955 [Neofusicoccum ribis]|uniref:Alpha/beta hydrolase fold-3 domain-containing protein n=1 Tax=Neofusicoccum ribis TaxID=45134 RepID=A0ABR3SLI7_9PEZI